MCAIIDNCVRHKAFSKPTHRDFVPLWHWVTDKKGAIVYGGRNKVELEQNHTAREVIALWKASGKAFEIQGVFEEELKVIERGGLDSDDPHVIALALLSGARTLCTEDPALEKDFKNATLVSDPRGRIYKKAIHKHLLEHTPGCWKRRMKH